MVRGRVLTWTSLVPGRCMILGLRHLSKVNNFKYPRLVIDKICEFPSHETTRLQLGWCVRMRLRVCGFIGAMTLMGKDSTHVHSWYCCNSRSRSTTSGLKCNTIGKKQLEILLGIHTRAHIFNTHQTRPIFYTRDIANEHQDQEQAIQTPKPCVASAIYMRCHILRINTRYVWRVEGGIIAEESAIASVSTGSRRTQKQ